MLNTDAINVGLTTSKGKGGKRNVQIGSATEKLKCLEAAASAHIPVCKWIIYCHVANSRNTLKVCKLTAS